MGLAVLIPMAFGVVDHVPIRRGQRNLLHPGRHAIRLAVILVLAALAVTSEYRFGKIRTTLRARRAIQPEDHPHRRGLTRAVRAQEAGHHTGFDGKRQGIDGRELTVLLGKASGLDHRGPPGSWSIRARQVDRSGSGGASGQPLLGTLRHP